MEKIITLVLWIHFLGYMEKKFAGFHEGLTVDHKVYRRIGKSFEYG